MIKADNSIPSIQPETVADIIVTARQYEISHGQLLAYVCAGGLLQTFLDHKKYGLQPGIDIEINLTSNNVIAIHSIGYYNQSHAHDSEILIIPASLLSEEGYASICCYKKENLTPPYGCTRERIEQAHKKLSFICEEISYYETEDLSEFQVIDGYQLRNEIFITSLMERLDKFNISFSRSVNLLNEKIKKFTNRLLSDEYSQSTQIKT